MPLLDASHDLAHPVGDDKAWSESYYFNAYAPTVDVGFFARIGIRPNAQIMDGFVWLWLPGNESAPLRWEREQHEMIDRRLEVGGVCFEMVEPMMCWTLQAHGTLGDGRAVEFDARFDAMSPAIGVDGTQGGTRTDPGDSARAAAMHAVAAGHLEQAGTWSGSVTIGGDRLSLDGARGNRDKSWGPRRMGGGGSGGGGGGGREPAPTRESEEPEFGAGVARAARRRRRQERETSFEGWRWFSINIGDRAQYGGVRIMTAAGDLHRGWVWRDGEASSIREWAITTKIGADGLVHESLDLDVRDKHDRVRHLHGDVLRAERLGDEAGSGCVVEALTRWTSDDGVGYGISEYAHVFGPDGQPVREIT